jgi:hypothetical protein
MEETSSRYRGCSRQQALRADKVGWCFNLRQTIRIRKGRACYEIKKNRWLLMVSLSLHSARTIVSVMKSRWEIRGKVQRRGNEQCWSCDRGIITGERIKLLSCLYRCQYQRLNTQRDFRLMISWVKFRTTWITNENMLKEAEKHCPKVILNVVREERGMLEIKKPCSDQIRLHYSGPNWRGTLCLECWRWWL